MDIPYMVTASYAFGVLVVLMFCITYFNEPEYSFFETEETCDEEERTCVQPASPKYLTNRYQYNFYLIAFILLTELFYVILVGLLPVLLRQEMGLAYDALASALIISGVMPNLPFVRRVVDKVKFFLHEMARIPRKGQSFYRFIRWNPISFSPVLMKNLLERKAYSALVEKEHFKRPQNSTGYLWAKLSYLHYYLKWETSSPIRRSPTRKDLGWSRIEASYQELREKAPDALGKGAGAEADAFRKLLISTLLRTYRLLTCALFEVERPSRDISQYTEEIGYGRYGAKVFTPSGKQIGLFVISTTVAILLGALTAGLLTWMLRSTLPWLSLDITARRIFLWIGYGVPLFVLPVLFVLLAKRHLSFIEKGWPMVTPSHPYEKMRDRPWHVYLIVTGLAYLVGLFALVLMSILTGRSGLYAILDREVYVHYAVWALVTVVTAGYVSYRLDSLLPYAASRFKDGVLKFLGALSQGVLTALAITLAFAYRKGVPVSNLSTLEGEDRSMLFCFDLMCLIIGFILFYASQFHTRKKENRAFTRFQVSGIPVQLAQRENAFVGSLVNVSQEGARIISEWKAAAGDVIRVALEDGASSEGTVVHCDRGRIHLHFPDRSIWSNLKGTVQMVPESA